MGKRMEINEKDIHLVFEILDDGTVAFLHCQKSGYREKDIADNQKDWYRLVEIQTAGEDQDDHHGSKYTGTLPGRRLKFQEIRDERNDQGRRISILQRDEKTGLAVESILQFMDSCNVVESWTEIRNEGEQDQVITYLSSFALTGITKSATVSWDQAAMLRVPSNAWYGEFQWKDNTLPELGLSKVFHYSTKRLSYSSNGTWSSHEYLPMGYVENTQTEEGFYFSILHNGSWHWEIGDIKDELYLQISGPTENENHWFQTLKKGGFFESVHVAVAPTDTGFEDAVREMTSYRRSRRRQNEDNEKLPVIFNDFMNCLSGDPTEEKEYPLIDAAAEAGCEYYTIDAGWYADGSWWSRVGEWKPSSRRFPHGLDKVLSYIKKKGMIPGLWLELEVMGIHCPIAWEKPDDWFFCRHGKRVIDHGRYQLDYRNPEVRAFADEVIRRLVEDYGAGYIKMDYNINAGIGTELFAESPGEGLLAHYRAYLAWLDTVFERYPELIIENCGSGGMRINDAMLQKHSIQSSSDQTDYLRYAAISAAAPAAVTPEQNAAWSYPMRNATEEETTFNMVNAMMMRIHQSGHLAELEQECFMLVKEGICCYKQYRHLLKSAYPFWPLGLPRDGQALYALGLTDGTSALLAVWNCNTEAGTEVEIPINEDITVPKKVYPLELPCEFRYESNKLHISMPAKSARIFQWELKKTKEYSIKGTWA